MTKIFVSYSRVDEKSFVKPLIELLREHYGYNNIWYDQRLIGGPPWWDQILKQINECDVFLYVLTNDSLDSVYCQAEHEEAQRLGRPIVFVQARGKTKIPPKIRRFQYIDMSDDVNSARTLVNLVKAIDSQASLPRSLDPGWEPLTSCPDDLPTEAEEQAKSEQRDHETSTTLPVPQKLLQESANLPKRPATPPGKRPSSDFAVMESIDEFEKALEIGDNDTALHLLDAIERSGETPSFFRIDRYRANLTSRKAAEREYRFIRLMMGQESIEHIREVMTQFREKYGTAYDPDNIWKQVCLSSIDLMPQPFDWIDIPGEDYAISKYPIINAQFEAFIKAGGYTNERWWTTEGWQTRSKKKWSEPRYWQDAKWNGAEQPVVGVSWFEAVAFCLWLSDVTDEKIMLPTEDQRQYAAQGDDGRKYPWGDEWDCQRCNNSVDPCNSDRTTPVQQYEGKGDSPFGVVDMVGNVWEWCLTDVYNGTNDINSKAEYRVLRGGSWYDSDTDDFRAATRNGFHPDNWLNGLGFRCARP